MNRYEIEALIVGFRDEYKEVYLTTVGEEDYIWRTLTRKEHSEIAEFAQSDYEAFERICQTCVLYPKRDWQRTLAYLPEQLAPQILDESGYGSLRKEKPLLDIFRKQLESFDAQAEVIINRAFPYITFEMMEDWTKEKLLRFVAKAEWQLTNIEGYKHMKLLTDEEIREQLIEEGEDPDEEVEPEPEFNIMDLANELRRRGQDPMLALRHLYQKPKDPYVERPMIGGSRQADAMVAGTNAWREGGLYDGRYDVIQKQVQRISRR